MIFWWCGKAHLGTNGRRCLPLRSKMSKHSSKLEGQDSEDFNGGRPTSSNYNKQYIYIYT